MNETPRTLTEFLAAERRRGYTAKDVAERLGISQPFLSQLKNGVRRARPKTAKLLAARSGLPIEVFLDPEPTAPAAPEASAC